MDTDEFTIEEMIDSLEDLDDEELVQLQTAVAQEIATRNDDGLDLDDDDFDDDDEDEE
jgi:hypothetical protein